MNTLLKIVQDYALGATGLLHAALRQGALIGAALLVALLGIGFLVFASFVGLRFMFGPGLAATVMGFALLACAAGLLLFVNRAERTVQPNVLVPVPQTPKQDTPSRPGDAASIAVFTTAFLLGRRLADRWASSRNT